MNRADVSAISVSKRRRSSTSVLSWESVLATTKFLTRHQIGSIAQPDAKHSLVRGDNSMNSTKKRILTRIRLSTQFAVPAPSATPWFAGSDQKHRAHTK